MRTWLLGLLTVAVALAGPRGPGHRPHPPRVGGARQGDTDEASDAKTGAVHTRLLMAEGFLDQGGFKGAVIAYRKLLRDHPDLPAAHVGLGRAYAKQGLCRDALDELYPQMGKRAFDVDAALAAAGCASRLGDREEALRLDELATEIAPNSVNAWTQLVLDRDRAGDAEGVDEAFDRLDGLNADKNTDPGAWAEAVLDLRNGHFDDLDATFHRWKKDGRSPRGMMVVVAWSWLDMDDPVEAERRILAVYPGRRPADAKDVLAEALRREDVPEDAMTVLDASMGAAEGPQADAIRARCLVDLGRVSEATDLLRGYDLGADPDLAASAWYLARAQGDAEGMAEWSKAYDEVRVARRRTLEQLVPLGKR